VITILAVAADAHALAPAFARHPSVEVLAARDAEDALEKLARNRRIDAVLLLAANAAAIACAIRAEDPGAPPLYALASVGAIQGVLPLPDEAPERAVERLAGLLQPQA
jgi:hypothetical protein